MEWKKENIVEIVEFINNKLKLGNPMVKIENEYFGENARVIHKRLIRLGYKKINNQYLLKENITSNITNDKEIKKKGKITCNNEVVRKEDNTVGENDNVEVFKNINVNPTYNDVDIDKLNLLLSDLDKILKLIPTDITSNITELRSGINNVCSFRIDTGLYKAVKERASRDNINIAGIINKALEDYLNNYL